jgi:hypothetical protein
MARTPKGFRNISTTYQLAYATLDGNVQVRQIGKRLWEILPRGGSAQFEKSKEAALDRAHQLTFKRKDRR